MTGPAAPPAPGGPPPVSPVISRGASRGAVTVKCLATLAAHQPENAGAFPLSEGIRRVADLLAALNLPAAKVTTILLNGAPADLDTPLSPGDAVTLLPTLSGG